VSSLKTSHGGICIFVHHDISARTVDLPTCKSFELLALFVRVTFSCFCSSPCTALHPPLTTIFFYDFADLLERNSSFAGCVIVGDLNLPLDDMRSSTTSRFVSLLDSFGLVEQIR